MEKITQRYREKLNSKPLIRIFIKVYAETLSRQPSDALQFLRSVPAAQDEFNPEVRELQSKRKSIYVCLELSKERSRLEWWFFNKFKAIYDEKYADKTVDFEIIQRSWERLIFIHKSQHEMWSQWSISETVSNEQASDHYSYDLANRLRSQNVSKITWLWMQRKSLKLRLLLLLSNQF